ncbi:MAG: VPLPA-CTERM sorting domain-containing protein [Pseudomonadota bacterium]
MTTKTVLLAAAFATAIAGGASAATVVNGSFEQTPGFSGKRNWQVYKSIEGWTTSNGAGMEIQSNATLRGIDAHQGNHYVELDSHGRNSNSTITQSIAFKAGTYDLSFYYAPRTTSDHTNGIQFSVGDYLLDQVAGPSGLFIRQSWAQVTRRFEVKEAGIYNLSFSAIGKQDTYGGLIDNVSISAVPLPASAFFLLGGLGLFGAFRRKST